MLIYGLIKPVEPKADALTITIVNAKTATKDQALKCTNYVEWRASTSLLRRLTMLKFSSAVWRSDHDAGASQ